MFSSRCHERFPCCLLAVQIQDSFPVLKSSMDLALLIFHISLSQPFPCPFAKLQWGCLSLQLVLHRVSLYTTLASHWYATCEVPGCHIFASAFLPHCYQFLNIYFLSLGNQSERVYVLDEMALYCPSINISSYLV